MSAIAGPLAVAGAVVPAGAALAPQLAAWAAEGVIAADVRCSAADAVGEAFARDLADASTMSVQLFVVDDGSAGLVDLVADPSGGAGGRFVGIVTDDYAVARAARGRSVPVVSDTLAPALVDRVGRGARLFDDCTVVDGRICELGPHAAAVRDGAVPIELHLTDDAAVAQARMLFDAGFRVVFAPVDGSAALPVARAAEASFGPTELAAVVERTAAALWMPADELERLVALLSDAWEARPPRLLHLAERDRWEAARHQASYLPAEWDNDGFIHLSALHQLLTPANRFYRGRDDLVALVVDAHHLGSAVVWEAGTGTVERFPHLYSSLPAEAVLTEVPIAPQPDGGFLLPPALVRAARSPLGR